MRSLLLIPVIVSVFILGSAFEASRMGVNVFGDPDQAVADTQELKLGWIRRFVGWDELEPDGPGLKPSPALDNLDRLINGAHNAGIKVNLTLLRSPSWAGISDHPLSAPRDPQQYGAFMARVAERYRGKVHSLEVWNEADEPLFWQGTPPGPESYAPILKEAYRQVKAVAPETEVVAGPFTANNYEFVEGLYRLGAGDSFDAVSVHTDTGCLVAGPYEYYRDQTGDVGRYSFLGFRQVRRVMVENGDSHKPINMSELGWSAFTGICVHGVWAGQKLGGVTEEQQAKFLTQAYHCLSEHAYIGYALWFGMRDYSPREEMLSRYGLISHDGRKRAAWQAMKDQVEKGDQLTEPCGAFLKPRLHIKRLSKNRVKARGFARNGALVRIDLRRAGSWKRFTAKDGQWIILKAPRGSKVRAVDQYGNRTEKKS